MPRKAVGSHALGPSESSWGLTCLHGAPCMGQAHVHYHQLAGTEDLGTWLSYFLHTSHQTVGLHASPSVPPGYNHWGAPRQGNGSSFVGISRPVATLRDPSLWPSPFKKALLPALFATVMWSSMLFSTFRTCPQTCLFLLFPHLSNYFFSLLHFFSQPLSQLAWGTPHKIVWVWTGRTLPLDMWLGLIGTNIFQQHWKD